MPAPLSGLKAVYYDTAGNGLQNKRSLGRITDATSGLEPILPDNAQDTALRPFHLGSAMVPSVVFTGVEELPRLQRAMETEERLDVELEFYSSGNQSGGDGDGSTSDGSTSDGSTSVYLTAYVLVRQRQGAQAETIQPGELRLREYRVLNGHYLGQAGPGTVPAPDGGGDGGGGTPGGGSTFTADVYASSTSGSDTNSGISEAEAFESLAALRAALNSLGAPGSAGLAGGSTWREGFDVLAGETVQGYGEGPDGAPTVLPIIDQADIIAPGEWTPHPTIANVYQVTRSHEGVGNSNRMNWWMEQTAGSGTQLATRVPDEAALDGNPGTYHQRFGTEGSPLTFSVHPYGSTDPRTDGKVYELVVRSSVNVNDGATLRLVETNRNVNNNGSIVGRKNVLIDRCVAAHGTKHNTFKESGETRDTVAFSSDTPYPTTEAGYAANEPTNTTFVAYNANADGLDAMWRRCHAVQPDNRASAWMGMYAHSSNDPTDRYDNVWVRGGSVYRHGRAIRGVANLTDVRGLVVREGALGGLNAASHHYSHNLVTFDNSEPILNPDNIGSGVPLTIRQNGLVGSATDANTKKGMVHVQSGFNATFENNVLQMTGSNVLGLKVDTGATVTARFNIIVPNTQSATSGLIWDVPTSGFTSDYNIFIQLDNADFLWGGSPVNLFDWYTTSGQDQNSVFVGWSKLWRGIVEGINNGPVDGDFRIDPNVPCNPLDGRPQQIAAFADGTSIFDAGITEVWDPFGGSDGLGMSVPGVPVAWPTTPVTKADARQYALAPTAWNAGDWYEVL